MRKAIVAVPDFKNSSVCGRLSAAESYMNDASARPGLRLVVIRESIFDNRHSLCRSCKACVQQSELMSA